jgi:hypothetical protein
MWHVAPKKKKKKKKPQFITWKMGIKMEWIRLWVQGHN